MKCFPSSGRFWIKKLKQSILLKKNEGNFKVKDGTVSKYQQLDTSIPKLRRKYVNLKVEWRRLTERCKNGSGLSPEKELKWFGVLNEVFSETNSEITLAASYNVSRNSEITLTNNVLIWIQNTQQTKTKIKEKRIYQIMMML